MYLFIYLFSFFFQKDSSFFNMFYNENNCPALPCPGRPGKPLPLFVRQTAPALPLPHVPKQTDPSFLET
jgi:hypothetical protein